MSDLTKKIKNLPDTPGVYLFFNLAKELIYVGKATSLHSRVRSYWFGAKTMRPIEQMIDEVKNIKTISTDSALEAVVLEGNYIKKYRPKYNVDWKDDKSWNYILITRDPYPKVSTLREHEWKQINESERKKKYLGWFGPYPGLKTKDTLRLLQKLFLFSTCEPNAKRPCLYYQMGQCLGVCAGEITRADYRKKVIKPLMLFLAGSKRKVLVEWEKAMMMASKNEDYETAARLHNQIKSLQRIQDVALLNESWIKEDLPRSAGGFAVKRIEGYDISNLGASGKVGSMVVFDSREPTKSEYRKFNIKTVAGQGDIDCLREVLTRRLKHDDWPLPEIFLIDGGLPQVNVVRRVLQEAKTKIPIVGIAKGPKRDKNEFFVANVKAGSEVGKWIKSNKNLLIQVRDEAHRFAINFQKTKRKIKYVKDS
jgi:excinuclease ABC subunit C